MSDDQPIRGGDQPAGKIWLALGFVAIWSVASPLVLPPEGKAIMEDAAGFAGRMFGHGALLGLIAAVIAHLAALRRAAGRWKWAAYVAGAFLGGLTSLLVHG